MSPAHVLEPTYQRLKRALMEGTWANGAKLEAMRLADDFGVSMTPVRDSLNQLVGEGLVDLTPGDGFRVPVLTEQGLRDVLRVNAVLLETASDEVWRIPNARDLEDWPDDYAGRMAAVFLVLAAGIYSRRAVGRRKFGQGPHDIEQIFMRALLPCPHVVVAMRELLDLAGMDCNRLRDI